MGHGAWGIGRDGKGRGETEIRKLGGAGEAGEERITN
jgi:hypothetical protein